MCDFEFYRKRIREQIEYMDDIFHSELIAEERKSEIIHSALQQLNYYRTKIWKIHQVGSMDNTQYI
jgi:hypothetical protein